MTEDAAAKGARVMRSLNVKLGMMVVDKEDVTVGDAANWPFPLVKKEILDIDGVRAMSAAVAACKTEGATFMTSSSELSVESLVSLTKTAHDNGHDFVFLSSLSQLPSLLCGISDFVHVVTEKSTRILWTASRNYGPPKQASPCRRRKWWCCLLLPRKTARPWWTK